MSGPVILFDYDASPLAQKIRLVLTVAKIPYQRCEQPILIPRPFLHDLGITYRRIPLLSVGKEVFCDSSAIISAIQDISASLPTNDSDKAFEVFGLTLSGCGLRVFPAHKLNERIIKDRETLLPARIFRDPAFPSLRPSALGELGAMLYTVEHEFLASEGRWIHGEEISLADVHVFAAVKWILLGLGVGSEHGFGRDYFPKIYTCLDNLPKAQESGMLSGEEAKEMLFNSTYVAESSQPTSSLPDISLGTEISIESVDTVPGSHPQVGKLVDVRINRVTVEVKDGLRVHFPRRGYIIRQT